MGGPSSPNDSRVRRISLTPKLQVGFISDGKLLNFKSPFPHGESLFTGGEASLEFRSKSGSAGELVLSIMKGEADDYTDQSKLPLGDDYVSRLVKFQNARQSQSEYLSLEWRWTTGDPMVRSRRWTLLQPKLGLGLGVLNTKALVKQLDKEPVETSAFNAVALGSTHLKFAELHAGWWGISLEGSLNIFVGKILGIMGGLSLSFNMFKDRDPK